MRRRAHAASLSWLLLLAATARAAETREQRVDRYLDSIRNQPSLLIAFLREMPKGADLHNHLTGAVYAESYIGFAARDGLCVDRGTYTLLRPPCRSDQNQLVASQALADPVLYREMIDAYSMRNFTPALQSAHDHFFDAFRKFDAATETHQGEMLAEVVFRAAAQHELYMELMLGPGRAQAIRAAAQVGWDEDLARLREKLMAHGIGEAVSAGRTEMDKAEKKMREVLRCAAVPLGVVTGDGSLGPDPGCRITVRYIYDTLRGLAPEQVFAQLLLAFELARADSRMVAVNLVMPEDAYIPMRDFDLHMRMMDYLHGLYPQVHITLHAGELAPGLVPPEGLRFHIRESMEKGHAERIGHGVDVMHEDRALDLLAKMRGSKVLVEICLTSNDMVLSVRGLEHPLPVYLRYGIPVALATDDEGVARSDLTLEYKRAVETYHLIYAQLKKMARDSIEYSFLPGASLWSRPDEFVCVPACAGVDPQARTTDPACEKLLAGSEKARVEWNLEHQFALFEEHEFMQAGP